MLVSPGKSRPRHLVGKALLAEGELPESAGALQESSACATKGGRPHKRFAECIAFDLVGGGEY